LRQIPGCVDERLGWQPPLAVAGGAIMVGGRRKATPDDSGMNVGIYTEIPRFVDLNASDKPPHLRDA
jgi:hypothetical protein